MFHKKAILKNFVISTGKHLFWGPFFIKFAGIQASNCILKDFGTDISSWNWETYKNTCFEEHLGKVASVFLETVLWEHFSDYTLAKQICDEAKMNDCSN